MTDPTERPRPLEDTRVESARKALAEYDATSIGAMSEIDLLAWLGRFAVMIENLLAVADQRKGDQR